MARTNSSAPSKTRQSLLMLPGEILNVIFRNVVTSSTGFVTLEFRNMKQTLRIIEYWKPRAGFGRREYDFFKNIKHPTSISLAFLRTCKKIHDDFRDLVFMANTFVIDMLSPVCLADNTDFPHQLRLRDSFTHRLQKIHIDFYLFNLHENRDSLKLLKQWVSNGNLRYVTLATTQANLGYRDSVENISRTFKLLNETFPGVVLKVVFTMGTAVQVKRLTHERSRNPERVRFDDLVRSMHQVLGGEFWIGDTLCWKDGNQVSRIPKLD